MAFVYSITNTISGKQYIGICGSKVRRRWRRHVNSAEANKPRNRNCPALHAAIRKYGEAAFLVETIYEASTWLEACKVERGIIAERGTMAPHGYNLTSGGEGRLGCQVSAENRLASSVRSKGKKASPETRKKLSASLRGRKLSAGQCAQMRKASIERWADPVKREMMLAALARRPPPTPETRAKMSLAAKGRKHRPETRSKMSAWQIGKKLSDETKQKISAGHRGKKLSPEAVEAMRLRPFTPEHRAKIKAALKDRYFSPEHRARISEGLRRRWARSKALADAVS